MTLKTFDEIVQSATDILFEKMGPIDVTYRKRSGGDDRTIEAIVTYPLDRPGDETPRIGSPRIVVIVKNDSTDGIAPDSDGKLYGDLISVPPRKGATAKWCRIIKVNAHNPGFIKLEVQ